MINFICHLDWAIGYPTNLSNTILGMSEKIFLEKINIWMGRLCKAHCSPECRWVSSNKTKGPTFPLVKMESAFLIAFKLRHGLFLPSNSTEIWALLSLWCADSPCRTWNILVLFMWRTLTQLDINNNKIQFF